jgi:hypothetical protein
MSRLWLKPARLLQALHENAYTTSPVQRYRGAAVDLSVDVLLAEQTVDDRQRSGSVADLESRAFALDVALVRALGGGFTRRLNPIIRSIRSL